MGRIQHQQHPPVLIDWDEKEEGDEDNREEDDEEKVDDEADREVGEEDGLTVYELEELGYAAF